MSQQILNGSIVRKNTLATKKLGQKLWQNNKNY